MALQTPRFRVTILKKDGTEIVVKHVTQVGIGPNGNFVILQFAGTRSSRTFLAGDIQHVDQREETVAEQSEVEAS